MPYTLRLPATELWDSAEERFIERGAKEVVLEHSLDSIRRWESKWHKAFLHDNDKTPEMMNDYVKTMCIKGELDDADLARLTQKDINEIGEYIEDPHTATSFHEQKKGRPSRDIMTAEVIYYIMVEIGIPFETQFWHINQLLTLIHVYQVKQEKPKKMGKRSTAASNVALNAARRRKLGSLG